MIRLYGCMREYMFRWKVGIYRPTYSCSHKAQYERCMRAFMHANIFAWTHDNNFSPALRDVIKRRSILPKSMQGSLHAYVCFEPVNKSAMLEGAGVRESECNYMIHTLMCMRGSDNIYMSGKFSVHHDLFCQFI